MLDQVEKLATGKKECSQSTMKKTVESTGQTWDKHGKRHEMVSQAEKTCGIPCRSGEDSMLCDWEEALDVEENQRIQGRSGMKPGSGHTWIENDFLKLLLRHKEIGGPG